jgi:hypothetical protein
LTRKVEEEISDIFKPAVIVDNLNLPAFADYCREKDLQSLSLEDLIAEYIKWKAKEVKV